MRITGITVYSHIRHLPIIQMLISLTIMSGTGQIGKNSLCMYRLVVMAWMQYAVGKLIIKLIQIIRNPGSLPYISRTYVYSPPALVIMVPNSTYTRDPTSAPKPQIAQKTKDIPTDWVCLSTATGEMNIPVPIIPPMAMAVAWVRLRFFFRPTSCPLPWDEASHDPGFESPLSVISLLFKFSLIENTLLYKTSYTVPYYWRLVRIPHVLSCLWNRSLRRARVQYYCFVFVFVFYDGRYLI